LINRRQLISSAFVGIIGSNILKSEGINNNISEDIMTSILDLPKNKISEDELNKFDERIFPRGLKPGDTVAISAMASPATLWEVQRAINFFRKHEIKVEICDSIKNNKGKYYLTNTDEARAEELNNLFKREDINGIMAARGGYGTMRILDYLDYEMIKLNPKILIGFSDITAVLIAINRITNLITYHGPVAVTSFNEFSANGIMNVIKNKLDFDKILNLEFSQLQVLNEGNAKGYLTGGNLRMICSTLGTKYEIDTKGKVLFLEDTQESSYKIDRMLTQLKLAGKLDDAVAILLGNFDNINKRTNFFPNKSYTTKEVFDNTLKSLNIPVIFELNFGHTSKNQTLPIGANCEVDTKSKKITLLEQPISLV